MITRRWARRRRAVRLSNRAAVAATVLFVAACATGSFWWIYTSHLAQGPPIRSDAMGYYLYLPAVVLDHDVTLERTAQRSFSGHPNDMAGVRRVPPNNHYLDKYPVGEAIMLVPFFVVGDAAARASGAEDNGFSTPYQVAAAAAGLVYALLGLTVLGFVLVRWFSTSTVVLTLLAITFGTALFHYATYDAVFSHAFSFLLVAVIFRVALAVRARPRTLNAALLGMVTGLLVAVRPTNATILVFISLLGVSSLRDVGHRLDVLGHHYQRLVAVGIGAFIVPLVPQIAYWHSITGKFLVYAYGNDEHLDVLNPHLLDVLFSVRKGLFFWSPLLLLAVAGLPLLRRRASGTLVPAVAYLSVNAWVISSWSTWWYGGSLGQRPFVESLPVFALGLAALIETVRGRLSRRLLLASVTVLTLLALHSMVAYWEGAIPFDETTWHVYVRSLGLGLRH